MEENYLGVGLIWILIGIIVIWLVYYYGNKKIPWYVFISTFTGWIFPFSIVLLLPVDLTSTLFRTCTVNCDPPLLYVSEDFLWVSWRVIYWTMFALTYFILPFVQAYCDSGYFTAWEKSKKALRANIIYYAFILALAAFIIIWLAIGGYIKDKDSFMGFAMALANLFGLSFLVVLLAYGLVEVPKSLWFISNHQRMLRFYEFQAPKVKDSLHDAEALYYDLSKQIYSISNKIQYDDPLRPFVDKVMEKRPLSAETTFSDHSEPSPENSNIDMIELAKIHKNLIRAARLKEKCEWEWNNLCNQAFFLQDILMSSKDKDLQFVSTLRNSSSTNQLGEIFRKLELIWFIHFQSPFLIFTSLLAGLMSIVIIWSETTYIFTSPIISIIGSIVNIEGISYAVVELLSVTFLLYMCACAIYSLFKVKLFDKYSLHPNHHTTEVSLCWFTSQMCRLTFPLCYNYLTMANLIENDDFMPVFSKLMGKMNIAPVIGNNFQFYVPILLVVICFSNLFDIPGRLMRICGFSDDFFSGDSKEGLWGDVEDGRILLAEARGKLERKFGNNISSTDIKNLSGNKPISTSIKTPFAGSSNTSKPKSDAPLSNYKANNPLYEKYQKKFNERNQSKETDSQERKSLFSTSAKLPRSKSPIKPASRSTQFSSLNPNKPDTVSLLHNDEEAQESSRFKKNLPNFDQMWK